ncbi:MAG: hypothetical protein IT444_12550 [Phycisphaeraceae bacterium]|nr:hypothetical protein [Phycisphaeraceae bacterium]
MLFQLLTTPRVRQPCFIPDQINRAYWLPADLTQGATRILTGSGNTNAMPQPASEANFSELTTQLGLKTIFSTNSRETSLSIWLNLPANQTNGILPHKSEKCIIITLILFANNISSTLIEL